MNFRYIFKVITLFASLVMTIYCIYLLNQGHLSDFLGSVGMGKYSQNLNWCSNRVSKIENANPEGLPWVLEEKDKKWLITKDSAAPQTLPYLDVEKWLAQSCQIHILVYRSENLLDKHLQPFAKVYFNDGKMALISVLDKDTFQINEIAFKAPEMQTAIEDLKNLIKID
jgi:hypothetical protein